MDNTSQLMKVQYDTSILKQVQINRQKLIPIVEAIILCGRNNMSFCIYRDDSKYYDDTENNTGNLQAILSYLVRCGDNKIFQDHFDNAPKSATYSLKTTQNSIIKICGNILAESANFFRLLRKNTLLL